MSTRIQHYEVSLTNYGNLDKHKAEFIVMARDDIFTCWGHWANVIKVGDKTLIDNDLCVMLGMKYSRDKRITFGRKSYWVLSDQMFDNAQEHIEFPPYNQRERNVRERNRQAVDWLMGLYLGLEN